MTVHRIQSGDTLSQLAQRYGSSVQELAKANNIKNPDLIIAGKQLHIPDGFERGPARGSATRPAAPTGGAAAPHAHDHDHDHGAHSHPVGATTTSPTSASGGIRAGGGWGGSEGVADAAKDIARQMGIPVTSQKRDLAATQRVGSSTGSDHFTGNTNAFAVDLGVSGARGDQLARAIAQRYGIPESNIGTYNRHVINVDGQRYSLQLLWKVQGHFDHVHLGIRRA
jgi:murein DD-endopeptidase MepM/ murein hydrolase activator NlpD